jgi:8-oxo-dGTP pyrophosphatase MutT (NUDIX family)
MPMSPYMRRMRSKIGTDLLMMPAVSAIIMDDDGKILLQRRSDNGKWSTPGGAIDPREEPADAIVREVYEECNLKVVPERIIGVYGGEDHLLTYPNGDQVAIISIVFLCKIIGGTLKINDDESLELRYFAPDDLPQLHSRYAIRIHAALQNTSKIHFRMNFKD